MKDGDSLTTSARQHNDSRTMDSSQRGPTLYVGPNYKQLKHLGTCLAPDTQIGSHRATWASRIGFVVWSVHKIPWASTPYQYIIDD